MNKNMSELKTVRFTYDSSYGFYRYSEPGDHSGEYVRAEDVRELVVALNRLIESLPPVIAPTHPCERATRHAMRVVAKHTKGPTL
jgi:hypothetical protein